jgi:hypothetical protein
MKKTGHTVQKQETEEDIQIAETVATGRKNGADLSERFMEF